MRKLCRVDGLGLIHDSANRPPCGAGSCGGAAPPTAVIRKKEDRQEAADHSRSKARNQRWIDFLRSTRVEFWHTGRGIAPAPERGKSMSWSTFLKAHWGAIAATDLFTVEVVNPFGLVRYHVLFVIDIATRCVCIGGMTSDPNGEWMKQAARNVTDMWDGFLLGKRYLIHDRDPLFTEAVRGLLRDSGVKPLRLPANSPNLNAYAERFVLSIRRECLRPLRTSQ